MSDQAEGHDDDVHGIALQSTVLVGVADAVGLIESPQATSERPKEDVEGHAIYEGSENEASLPDPVERSPIGDLAVSCLLLLLKLGERTDGLMLWTWLRELFPLLLQYVRSEIDSDGHGGALRGHGDGREHVLQPIHGL